MYMHCINTAHGVCAHTHTHTHTHTQHTPTHQPAQVKVVALHNGRPMHAFRAAAAAVTAVTVRRGAIVTGSAAGHVMLWDFGLSGLFLRQRISEAEMREDQRQQRGHEKPARPVPATARDAVRGGRAGVGGKAANAGHGAMPLRSPRAPQAVARDDDNQDEGVSLS